MQSLAAKSVDASTLNSSRNRQQQQQQSLIGHPPLQFQRQTSQPNNATRPLFDSLPQRGAAANNSRFNQRNNNISNNNSNTSFLSMDTNRPKSANFNTPNSTMSSIQHQRAFLSTNTPNQQQRQQPANSLPANSNNKKYGGEIDRFHALMRMDTSNPATPMATAAAAAASNQARPAFSAFNSFKANLNMMSKIFVFIYSY